MNRRIYFCLSLCLLVHSSGALAQDRVMRDMRKSAVEMPLERSIAPLPKPALLTDVQTAPGKVMPGQVRWHATMEEAQAASAKSGKPVFLFTLMGKLDEKFC